MKHLSVSKIISASTDECLSMLSEGDREMAKRLGNDPRAVLLRRAQGGLGDSAIVLDPADHDAARGPWSRAEFADISKSLGNDPVIAAARFEARGGKFTDEDSDPGSDDGSDDGDEPLAAAGSNEERLHCSDDGARARAVQRMNTTGAALHHGQAQPFLRTSVVGRARRP